MQAKDVFEKICPDEEFLQAVPNPEDIILDDFLQDGNQNVVEPEGGNQGDAAESVSGEEDDEEGDISRQPGEGEESHCLVVRQEQDEAGAADRKSDEEDVGLGTGQDQADSSGANLQPTEGDKRVSDVDSASRQSSEESKLAAAAAGTVE